MVLMAAFFIYNIQYPRGFANVFSFLEIFLLQFIPKQSTSCVTHLLSIVSP